MAPILSLVKGNSDHRIMHVGTNDVKSSKSLGDIAILGNISIPQNNKTESNVVLVSSIAPPRDNNGTGSRQNKK